MKKLIMVIISLIMVLGMCFVLGGCTQTRKGYGNIAIYTNNSYPYYYNDCNFEITKDYIKIVDKQANVSYYYYNVTFRIIEK